MVKVKPVKVTRGERLAKQLKSYYSEYLINAAAAPRMAEKLFPQVGVAHLSAAAHGGTRLED